jgi:2-amino-4-hydroxy-6-hydroxymethyldihydropteridine diphosphokinase
MTLIALGGNMDSAIGPPAATLKAALGRLGDSQLRVDAVSRYFSTPCFPEGAGPDYVNAAAMLSGDSDAQTILDVLHAIEAEFGRARDQRWGRRTLDLDLIALGDAILPDSATFETWRNLPLNQQMQQAPGQLILPHPRMQDRAFVLVPLAEIAPDWRHPVLGRTVMQMRDALSEADKSSVRPL